MPPYSQYYKVRSEYFVLLLYSDVSAMESYLLLAVMSKLYELEVELASLEVAKHTTAVHDFSLLVLDDWGCCLYFCHDVSL